jgi:hypothetical protein
MNVYSLGSWLTLCEALKIPAIPAGLLQNTSNRSPLKPK